MKKISYIQKLTPILLIAFGFVIIGCSGGDGTTLVLPTDKVTMFFDHNAASLDYNTLGVAVEVPPDTLNEGEMVQLQVQIAPPNLPSRAYTDSIHARIGWLDLKNTSDPDINLQKEIRVTFPLNSNYNAATLYSAYLYNPSDGVWHSTGRQAVITDDGLHAIFSANSFGTWGVFESIPLTVEISANRTTGQAPASIALDAMIDGGSPPYAIIWWFGDESDPESGISVSHMYMEPSTYTPCVIVVDAMNRQVSDDINIYVR